MDTSQPPSGSLAMAARLADPIPANTPPPTHSEWPGLGVCSSFGMKLNYRYRTSFCNKIHLLRSDVADWPL